MKKGKHCGLSIEGCLVHNLNHPHDSICANCEVGRERINTRVPGGGAISSLEVCTINGRRVIKFEPPIKIGMDDNFINSDVIMEWLHGIG